MTTHESLLNSIGSAPLVPVVTLNHVEEAVPVAEALREGGIRCIEVTMRTDAGLHAIEAIAKANLQDMVLGAGTLTSPERLVQAANAGAGFFVSPGLTAPLLEEAQKRALCLLPGVVTPSEIMQALAYGQRMLKFFPAGSFGGAAMLKNYASVFPQVSFCPTGGISKETAKDYLALPNVRCVGGTWLVPKEALEARDYARITAIARESVAAL